MSKTRRTVLIVASSVLFFVSGMGLMYYVGSLDRGTARIQDLLTALIFLLIAVIATVSLEKNK